MIPFRRDANLGRAYNFAMALVPIGDWAVLMDHDCMPTTSRWYAQLEDAIAFLPDAGAFVACVNRAARRWQRAGDAVSNDIAWHRRFGAERAKLKTLLDITETKGWAGTMFAIARRTWDEIGGAPDGLGCVDHALHYRLRDAGRRVYLVEGLYAFHWRHDGEPDPTSHAPKAADCPCMRLPDVTPTQRIALP